MRIVAAQDKPPQSVSDRADGQKVAVSSLAEIRETVGEGSALNALSGGVDSSVVTVLGHRALGDRLRTVFVDNALMREGEPERVVGIFAGMGIPEIRRLRIA